MLSHANRTRGVKEKVGKGETETWRTKSETAEKVISRVWLRSDVLDLGEKMLVNNMGQKLWCTEVHVLSNTCLPVFRQRLMQTSLDIGCCVSAPSRRAWSKWLWSRSNVANSAWVQHHIIHPVGKKTDCYELSSPPCYGDYAILQGQYPLGDKTFAIAITAVQQKKTFHLFHFLLKSNSTAICMCMCRWDSQTFQSHICFS